MSERRLNPFAFPAETNGRFTILIVSAIAITGLIGLNFIAIITALRGSTFPTADALTSISAVVDTVDEDTNLLDLSNAELAAYYENLRRPLRQALVAALPSSMAPLLLILLLCLVAWLFYRRHPHRIRRKYHRELLPPDDSPSDIRQAVDDLSTQVGVTPPALLVHRLVSPEQPAGQAFGFRNHYQIRLKAQLLYRKKRRQFKALLLHELGHIVNDDIWRAHFAAAIWATFAVLLLLMVAISIGVLVSGGNGTLSALSPWGLLARLIITLAVVREIWRSLLKIREFYADWRTVTWGQESALREWLTTSARWHAQKDTAWWRQLFSVHPSPQQREQALSEPIKLFRITWQLPFLTGFLLAITMAGFPFLLAQFSLPILGGIEVMLTDWAATLFRSPDPNNLFLFLAVNFILKIAPMILLVLVALFCIGYLLTTTLGVQVQRETVADMANKIVLLRSYGRLFPSAIWLSVGVQVGLLLTPVGYTLSGRWPTVALTLGWLLGFSLLTWLWLAYVRALTQIVLGAHVGPTDPKRKKRFVNVLSSLSLVFLYPPAFLLLAQAWIGDRVLPSLSAGSSELTAGQFMAMNLFMLFLLALVYFLGTILSLVILYGVMAFRSPARCPSCGEMTEHKLVMGQDCPYCHQPLSLWIYVKTGAR